MMKNDYWESQKSYFGLTTDQINKWLSLSNEEQKRKTDESNAIHERYLFDLQIAELTRWRSMKCAELLVKIDNMGEKAK